MAVLCEAISVVIKMEPLLQAYGSWEAFCAVVPNATVCADGDLARVGFMHPADVKSFIGSLEGRGLRYLWDGEAQDVIVIDQLKGPLALCSWIEFGHISLGAEARRVAVARLAGNTVTQFYAPDGWEFENSLSRSYSFVPEGVEERSLVFRRRERGLDVYFNDLTGKEVFMARDRE